MISRPQQYLAFLFYMAALTVLAGFAVQFHEERMFGEVGTDILCMINRMDFCVLSGRYGMIFPQILPVAFLKLQLPLRAVLVAFSISSAFFYFLLLLLAQFKYKDVLAGLGFILMLTVNLKSTYFLWSMSEIQYGAGLLILAHSIVRNDSRSPFSIVFMGVLVFFAIYSHPLVIYLLFVLIAYHVCDAGLNKIKRPLYTLMIWSGAFMLLKYVIMPDQYDFVKMNSELQPFSFSTSFSKSNLTAFFKSDFLMIGLWLVVLLFYSFKRNFLKLGLYTFSFIGLYHLLHATTPASANAGYHVAYGPAITGLLLFPLIYDVLGSTERKQFRYFILLVILTSVVRGQYVIHSMAWLFKHEVVKLKEIIDYSHRRGIDRGILKNDNLCANCLRPYYHQHSLLLSSLDGADRSVELEMDEQIFRDNYFDTLFMGMDMKLDSSLEIYMREVERRLPNITGPNAQYSKDQYKLNPIYFKTSEERHRVLSSNHLNPIDQLNQNISIEITEEADLYIKAGLWHPISIRITNADRDFPVYAGMDNGILIEIQWDDPEIESTFASLYGDIIDTYADHIMLEMPFGTNEYRVKAVLSKDGVQIGNTDSITVHIK